MRSYLSLASIQAKAHKRQNRMTIFCIMLAVILITGVFTMADMEYRHEILRMTENHGNWHIALKNITKEEAEAVFQTYREAEPDKERFVQVKARYYLEVERYDEAEKAYQEILDKYITE